MEIAYNPAKITLYYQPIYSSPPSYFKFQKADEFLTEGAVKTKLAERKISIIDEDLLDQDTFTDLVFNGIAICFPLIFYIIFGGGQFSEPQDNEPLCSRNFWEIKDPAVNNSWDHRLSYPCIMNYYDRKRHHSMKPYLSLIILGTSIVITFVVSFILRNNRTTKQNCLADRFNQHLEVYSSKLTKRDDETLELLPKNAGIIFPYLSDDQLKLLNFPQLKKAKKYWEALFIEKLETSKFSKQQLKIWRLFQHLIEANPKRKLHILEEKISCQIIGSDPYFFETLVKTMHPISNEISTIFSTILKNEILEEKTSLKLDENDFMEIIETIGKGLKLKDIVRTKLGDLPFMERSKNSIIDRLEEFLETGELTLEEPAEIYDFLKFMKKFKCNTQPVTEWMENYFDTHLDEILKTQDLKLWLLDMNEHHMHTLKLKIDHYCEKKWRDEARDIFDIDQFESDYRFAKDYDLFLFEHTLRDYYLHEINNFIFAEGEIEFVKEITLFSLQIEELFCQRKATFLKPLERKIVKLLENAPEKIEKIATAAHEVDNYWLKALLQQVYEKNPEFYSSHWLSPFENFEVIINS